MKKFNQGKSSGGGRSFGRKSFGGRSSGGRDFGGRDRDRERPDMHQAICDECGEKCEVPFRPTGDKPVYCSDCFKHKRDDEPRRPAERDRRERPSFGSNSDRQMFNTICSKCGEKCEVPFRPTGDKPVYCSQCFEQNRDGGEMMSRGRGDKKDDGQIKSQLSALNEKLDRILSFLEKDVPKKPDTKKVEAKVIEEKKEITEEKKPEPKKATKKKVMVAKKTTTKKKK